MRNPDCQDCPLWERAETPCLWGHGPEGAKLMVIAESPGPQEDRGGPRFGGRASKMFLEAIEESGLPQDPYITNAVKCKPPLGHKHKAGELKACKKYALEEIDQVKPEYVILLGATVLKALTGKTKITELHGQVLEHGGVKYFPTFHPAIALRDPSKLDPLKKDLLRLRQIMNGTLDQEPELDWSVIRTLDEWDSFVKEFSECDMAAFDLETNGLDRKAPGAVINTLQISWGEEGHEKAVAIPLCIRTSPWDGKMQKVFIETLVTISNEKNIKMCGQNAKFDNLWLEELYGVKFHLQFDTMLASHTLNENEPHGLKELSVHYCDASNYDIDLKTKKGQGDLNKLFKYGCFDVYYTLRLRRLFHSKLVKEAPLRRLFYKLVMPAARMFEDIERVGLFLNLPLLEKRRKELTRIRNNYERKLNLLAGKTVNWNSPKQVADLLYTDLGLPVLETTPTGAPSTGESVLLRLQEYHDIPALLIKMRGVEKNLSTYINGWEKLRHGEYLYLSTKLHGTVTGRYASRLHQVPRDKLIRSIIDAPTGWTFVCADYSQIELRLVAMASGDKRMMQAFQTGQDLHRLTASEVLAIPQEAVTKEQRKMAKAVNFGFVYGMWWKKFGIYARDNYGVIVSDRDSKHFRERYFQTYSGLEPWHKRQKRVVNALGYVTSLSGRKRRLPGVYSTDEGVRSEAERQSINSPIQGFGSGDLKAMALLEVHETFSSDVLMIKGEVHDSNLMWVRTDMLNEILPQVKKIMEHPKLLDEFGIKMTVPLVVDFEVGPWGSGEVWEFKE